MIKKGEWVQIERTILKPGERAPQVPEDTQKVPLIMWIKGFLQDDASLGEAVKVRTRTGRIETGRLVSADPVYELNYGDFVPELLKINIQVREELFGGVE